MGKCTDSYMCCYRRSYKVPIFSRCISKIHNTYETSVSYCDSLSKVREKEVKQEPR